MIFNKWKKVAIALNKALERECVERQRDKAAMEAMRQHIKELKYRNAALELIIKRKNDMKLRETAGRCSCAGD